MAHDPRMRASYIQGNVEALQLLGDDVAARIRADVGDELVGRIMRATRVDWMPLSVDTTLTAAVHRAVGVHKLRAWGKDAMLKATDGPLLRPILRAAISLFGLTPLSVLRHTPMVWKQIYLDCGEVRLEQRGPHHLRIHVDGAPDLMVTDVPYLEGICGAMEATFDLVRAAGTVTLERPSAVSIVFDVVWEALKA